MCFCIYIFICVLPDPLIFARREKKHTHAHTLIVIKANTHTHRHVPGLSSFYIWTYSPPSSPAEGLREITQRRGETKEGVGVLKNKQQQHVFTFSSSVTTTSSWQIIMWGGWGGGGEDAGVAVNFSTPPPTCTTPLVQEKAGRRVGTIIFLPSISCARCVTSSRLYDVNDSFDKYL